MRLAYLNDDPVKGRVEELTQSQLASYLGVGKETISRIESGKRKVVTSALLAKMAQLFGVNMEFLLMDDPEEFKQKR